MSEHDNNDEGFHAPKPRLRDEIREEVARGAYDWVKARWLRAWKFIETMFYCFLVAMAIVIGWGLWHLKSSAKNDAEKAQELVEQGEEHFKKSEYRDAKSCFERAVDLARLPDAYRWRGKLRVYEAETNGDLGQIKDAIQDLTRAINADKREETPETLADAYLWRGKAHLLRDGQGDRENAIDDLADAFLLDDTNAEPLIIRSRANIILGQARNTLSDIRFRDAVVDLSRAMELEPARTLEESRHEPTSKAYNVLMAELAHCTSEINRLSFNDPRGERPGYLLRRAHLYLLLHQADLAIADYGNASQFAADSRQFQQFINAAEAIKRQIEANQRVGNTLH